MRHCPRCHHPIRRYGYTCECGDYWDQDFFYAKFGFGMNAAPYTESNPGQLGYDVMNGDPTIGLDGGLVEDLRTGQVEFEVAPGIDLDLGF